MPRAAWWLYPGLVPSPTLSDVAREAGVSLATASRAFNGSATRTVRPELRDRVRDAAARLGYTPDANAQAMARGRSSALGLVVHDIADPYFSSVAAGLGEAAEAEGLVVTLASTRTDPVREVEVVELLSRQRARAIVLAGGRLDGGRSDAVLTAALTRYVDGGGRVATVGQPLGDLPCVRIANRDGARDLAAALCGLGYRDVVVLRGPVGHQTADERTQGLLEGFAAHGVEVPGERVVTGDFTRDGGYGAATGVLPVLRGRPGTAVVAVNDVMAVGAMAALRDGGLDVPAEVAVAGFDDIATLRDVVPGLTTVRLPLQEIGAAAARLALADDPAQQVVVRGEVVVRASTPPRP
nr:LacI family DNA-binding transcriptional regulator [Cellulosimicrobium arenosum]